MTHRKARSLPISNKLFAGMFLVMVIAGAAMILIVNRHMREQALIEAREKAEILLKERLAIHQYFNQTLKPSLFELTESVRNEEYFDPSWMSSTYAIRQIDASFHRENMTHLYYKECAVNARSPDNEADGSERAFLADLNRDPSLRMRSDIREIDGEPYFVILHRGEMLEEGCLRCHSTPDRAPADMVDFYGPDRSFSRKAGETVSAVSIRIPLAEAYGTANRLTARLSATLVGLLVAVSGFWHLLNRRYLILPLRSLQEKASALSTADADLGEAIPLPAGKEMRELTEAFNRMSIRLKGHVDELEGKVSERTADLESINRELTEALGKVKTLSGLLPICASCKKIRDDKGYWNQIEGYIQDHSDAAFSHGICPECITTLYPDPEGRLPTGAEEA